MLHKRVLPIVCWDKNRHPHQVNLTLRDSMLLGPTGKQALNQLGKLGAIEIPPTLSSVGVNMLLRHWREHGFDAHAVLGTETVTEKKWAARAHRYVRHKTTVPTEERRMFESFASDSYHGGRNEQFIFGAGREGTWTDWDLCGAYTTAMAVIGLPDWRAIRQTRDLDDFQPHVMGYPQTLP